MCNTVGKIPKLRVAKRNIKVIKFYFDDDHDDRATFNDTTLEEFDVEDRKLYSIVQRYVSYHKKVSKTKLSVKKFVENEYEVIGFCSYDPKNVDYMWGYDFEMECIIPKGSEYYIIKDRDKTIYVSDQIMSVKILKVRYSS